MDNRPQRPDGGGAGLSPSAIDGYLAEMSRRGCTDETVRTYRRSLMKLLKYLPREDATIREGTLERWREELLRDYTVRTVNVNISAANSYLDYAGARALQLAKPLPPPEEAQPELTRSEYLRMLERANYDGNERAYLLTKVFACTGLTVQELPRLTLEAVKAGMVERHAGLPAKLPACLRSELLSYARRQAIGRGPLFVTRSGRAMNRTAVTDTIQRLACAAKIEPGKGNPRCLRKLYLNAQHEIWRSLLPLAEQSHERLIETEQLAVGWKEEMDNYITKG